MCVYELPWSNDGDHLLYFLSLRSFVGPLPKECCTTLFVIRDCSYVTIAALRVYLVYFFCKFVVGIKLTLYRSGLFWCDKASFAPYNFAIYLCNSAFLSLYKVHRVLRHGTGQVWLSFNVDRASQDCVEETYICGR